MIGASTSPDRFTVVIEGFIPPRVAMPKSALVVGAGLMRMAGDALRVRRRRLCCRVIAVPLAWFPRLLHATPAQRAQVEFSSQGLHWEALDEDISVAGLLAGVGDLTRPASLAA